MYPKYVLCLFNKLIYHTVLYLLVLHMCAVLTAPESTQFQSLHFTPHCPHSLLYYASTNTCSLHCITQSYTGLKKYNI